MEGKDNLNVLLVEDDEINRMLMEALLDTPGLAVRTAGDGLEALTLIQEWEPDFLITDLVMPVVNGMTLIQKIRQMEMTFPILVVSVHRDISERDLADPLHAATMLHRPVTNAAFRREVNRIIEKLEAERTS